MNAQVSLILINNIHGVMDSDEGEKCLLTWANGLVGSLLPTMKNPPRLGAEAERTRACRRKLGPLSWGSFSKILRERSRQQHLGIYVCSLLANISVSEIWEDERQGGRGKWGRNCSMSQGSTRQRKARGLKRHSKATVVEAHYFRSGPRESVLVIWQSALLFGLLTAHCKETGVWVKAGGWQGAELWTFGSHQICSTLRVFTGA